MHARLTVAATLVLACLFGVGFLGRQEASAGVVFIGAGDIANCDDLEPARATARLLEQINGTIFTVGDHAYPKGTARQFRECYGTTWGRFRLRTRPAIGNHDVEADNGHSYFDYFGERAGPKGLGYYSYDLGAWHVISLNSNVTAGPRSAQMKWLRDDLAAHPSTCVLAYWHVPRFSSGARGGGPEMTEPWRALYKAGADVIVNGHDHLYERFAPQSDQGKPDPERGIRQFVVGTGGGKLESLGRPAPNSEVRQPNVHGVLKLTLSADAYAWEFVPIAGQTFHDAGNGRCSPSN